MPEIVAFSSKKRALYVNCRLQVSVAPHIVFNFPLRNKELVSRFPIGTNRETIMTRSLKTLPFTIALQSLARGRMERRARWNEVERAGRSHRLIGSQRNSSFRREFPKAILSLRSLCRFHRR